MCFAVMYVAFHFIAFIKQAGYKLFAVCISFCAFVNLSGLPKKLWMELYEIWERGST